MNRNQKVGTSMASIMFGLLLGTALLMACEGDPGAIGAAPAGQAEQSPEGVAGVAHAMRPMGADDSTGQTRHPDTPPPPVCYGGGGGGDPGVDTQPRVYLVFWGSQWNNNDPSGEKSILQSFFNGIGGSEWNTTVTQYCQGVAYDTCSCKGLQAQTAGNPANLLAGSWSDNASPAPSHPADSDFQTEVQNAAAYFHNTTSTANRNAVYIIATATLNNSPKFGCASNQICADHNYWNPQNGYGDLAWVDFPYNTDISNSSCCGYNFNGLGATAGITIVAGHEFAEVETDPFPGGGWHEIPPNGTGEEIADKCQFIQSGQGAVQNITLSTGTFPVQSLWSDATSACDICMEDSSGTCCQYGWSANCAQCTRNCAVILPGSTWDDSCCVCAKCPKGYHWESYPSCGCYGNLPSPADGGDGAGTP